LISNFRLLRNYKRILKQVNPQVILSFTIKPNLFLPLVKGKEMRIIANITGLGRSFQKKGLLNFVVVSLYKKAFSKVDFVFFQNEEIRDVFAKLRIPVKSSEVIPGSGVDASYFFYKPIIKRPANQRCFLFSARLIPEKGIDLFLDAARLAKKEFSSANFIVAGKMDSKYSTIIEQCVRDGVIEYKGFVSDMRELYWQSDCVVLPSVYKEGMSNVLLEALSCGRVIITSKITSGCKETVLEGENGFGINPYSVDDLLLAERKILSMSEEQLNSMGEKGSSFVKESFNREYVVDRYLKVINSNV